MSMLVREQKTQKPLERPVGVATFRAAASVQTASLREKKQNKKQKKKKKKRFSQEATARNGSINRCAVLINFYWLSSQTGSCCVFLLTLILNWKRKFPLPHLGAIKHRVSSPVLERRAAASSPPWTSTKRRCATWSPTMRQVRRRKDATDALYLAFDDTSVWCHFTRSFYFILCF